MSVARSVGSWLVDRLGVVAVALLALLSVWIPYDGDPALFTTAARTLDGGGWYLRDFWDIKQPGIYWIYQVIHQVPGPLWLPSRLVFGVAAVVLAWVVLVWARTALRSTWAVRLAPLLVVAPLLMTMRPDLLGVPEAVIPLALLGSVVLLRRSAERRSVSGLVLAGAVGGCALVVKAPYAVVLVALAGAVLLQLRPHVVAKLEDGTVPRSWRELAGTGAWYALGVAVPVGGTVVAYAVHGDLGVLVTTTFRYPPAIAALGTLHEPSSYWYFLTTATKELLPLSALGVVGLVWPTALQRRWNVLWLVWILSAAAVVAIQKPNTYQTQVLAVPLALVAASGLDALLAGRVTLRWRRLVWAAVAVTAVLALPWYLLPPAGVARAALAAGGVPTTSALTTVADRISPDYRTSEALVASRPLAAPQSVYVFGDPMVYVLLDRQQAVEVNGWSSEFAVPAQWTETERELRRTLPQLVLVDRFADPYLRRGSPGIVALLAADYSAHPGYDGSTWYVRNPGVPAGPLPVTAEGALIGSP